MNIISSIINLEAPTSPPVSVSTISGLLLNNTLLNCATRMWYLFLLPVLYGLYWLRNNVHKTDLSHRKANVVITGGSKGIGYALAVEFVSLGDNVVITSRDVHAIEAAVEKIKQKIPQACVFGFAPCDISSEKNLQDLAAFSQEKLGRIDYWINNAGCSHSKYVTLTQTDFTEIKTIIDTNCYGTLIATKIAINTMINQKETLFGKKGHVFLMDGAGSNGMSTPTFATYGMSKAGYPQLLGTLLKETKDTGIGIHILSPGMVLTDLLLKDEMYTPKRLAIFNIMCELPDTVAKWLVPRVRGVRRTGSYIRFLTYPGVFWRFLTAWFRKNKFFDPHNYKPIKND